MLFLKLAFLVVGLLRKNTCEPIQGKSCDSLTPPSPQFVSHSGKVGQVRGGWLPYTLNQAHSVLWVHTSTCIIQSTCYKYAASQGVADYPALSFVLVLVHVLLYFYMYFCTCMLTIISVELSASQ